MLRLLMWIILWNLGIYAIEGQISDHHMALSLAILFGVFLSLVDDAYKKVSGTSNV